VGAPVKHVVDVNAAARERGVCPGLSEAEAVARCPGLVRRADSAERLAAARRALLDACSGVSPRLEDAAPGLVYLDVAGLGRLVGVDPAIADRLARAARAVGLPAKIGVAATRTAARIAAQARLGVIAPGDDARVLAG